MRASMTARTRHRRGRHVLRQRRQRRYRHYRHVQPQGQALGHRDRQAHTGECARSAADRDGVDLPAPNPASASSDSIIGRISSACRRGAISLRSINASPTQQCGGARFGRGLEASRSKLMRIYFRFVRASIPQGERRCWSRPRRSWPSRRERPRGGVSIPVDLAGQVHQRRDDGKQRDRTHQQRVLFADDQPVEQRVDQREHQPEHTPARQVRSTDAAYPPIISTTAAEAAR